MLLSVFFQGQTHAMNELATGYRQDIEGAKSDLQMMRALLGSYSESRTSLGSDVDGLQSQLRASKDRAERAERELQQKKSELDQVSFCCGHDRSMSCSGNALNAFGFHL